MKRPLTWGIVLAVIGAFFVSACSMVSTETQGQCVDAAKEWVAACVVKNDACENAKDQIATCYDSVGDDLKPTLLGYIDDLLKVRTDDAAATRGADMRRFIQAL